MVFFTRELYLGIQPDSGWERRACNEWERRVKILAEYEKSIAPMLPATVRRLCERSLHDGKVINTSLIDEELTLNVDVSRALTGFRGPLVRLIFRGVKNRPRVSKLVGQWWLYMEAHLCSRARFSFHVLFDMDELEVEADELAIKQFPLSSS